MPKFKKVRDEVVLDNGFRKIIARDYEVTQWKIYEYFVSSQSKWNEAVIVFPLTKNNEVVYIKEFRVWIEDYIYSFPMGIKEPDLSLEENAKKELKEETWWTCMEINYLWETIVANYDKNIVKHFFASGVELGLQNLETWEDIEVFKCSLKEFEEKIKKGIINCPLTLSCYTFAKLKGYV